MVACFVHPPSRVEDLGGDMAVEGGSNGGGLHAGVVRTQINLCTDLVKHFNNPSNIY